MGTVKTTARKTSNTKAMPITWAAETSMERWYAERPTGSATLTAEQALEIYALAWAGDLTQREIAERFGVLQVLVSCIKHGRNWAEITGHKKILLQAQNPSPTRPQ